MLWQRLFQSCFLTAFIASVAFAAPVISKKSVHKSPAQPTLLVSQVSYPDLWPSAAASRWVILKCKLKGVSGTGVLPAGFPADIPDVDTLVDRFLTTDGTGTGNLIDYYKRATYSHVHLETQILGWYQATETTSVTTSSQRTPLVEDCANAAPARELTPTLLGSIDGLIVVVNGQISSGAGNVGKTTLMVHGIPYDLSVVTFDSASMYTAFAAHEVGHGFGLQHSRNSAGVDYGDPFDLMSTFSTDQYLNPRYPAEGGDIGNGSGSGPGLNVPNLMFLNALPPNRLATYLVSSGQVQSYRLSALSHGLGSRPLGLLILWQTKLPGLPVTISPVAYTVEYRQNDGEDAGFQNPVVLVHRVHSSTIGYPWQNDLDAVLIAGQTFQASMPPELNFQKALNQVYISVDSIDPNTGCALVHVGPNAPSNPQPPPR